MAAPPERRNAIASIASQSTHDKPGVGPPNAEHSAFGGKFMPGRFTTRMIRVALLGTAFAAPSAQAADFTIVDGQTETTTQTLTDTGDIGRIEAGGAIITSEVAEDGVQVTGDGTYLYNDGTITTTRVASDAIYVSGNNGFVYNNGTISTTANVSNGITIAGDGVTAINSGEISLSSDGISASGHDATMINNGTITVRGPVSWAMSSTEASPTIINTNTIIITGEGSYGLRSTGPARGATILNSGTILTTGDRGNAINSSSDDATVTNSGTITTTGDDAVGIRILGDNMILTNDGTITTTGDDAFGIRGYGDNEVMTNNGTISTALADGVYAQGDGQILINNGAITALGDGRYGVFSSGDDVSITTSGSINTSGDGSHGIYSTGAGAQLTNSGTILAAGANSNAIDMAGTDATLTLLHGTALQGGLSFLHPDSATLNIAIGLHTALTLTGVPVTIDTNGQPYVLDGSVLAVVDPTGFEALDAAHFGLTRLIAGVLEARMAASDDDALTTGAVNAFGSAQRDGLWMSALGTSGWRPASDDASAYEDRLAAVVLGHDGVRTGTDIAGGFVGFSTGLAQTDGGSSAADFTGLFAGAYWGHDGGSLFADLSLTAGRSSGRSERTIANNLVAGGLETASARTGAYFASPSATFGFHANLGGTQVSPSLRLRYAGLFNEAYAESGSAADMTVGDRMAQSFEARGQVRLDFPGLVDAQGVTNFGLKAGVDGIFTDNGTVDASLLGADLSFAAGPGQWTARGFVGGDFAFTATNGLIVKAGAEAGYDSVGALSLTAMVSARHAF